MDDNRVLLEQMQDKCVKSNKFVEAELCKQRIQVFKKKEKEKYYEELLKRHKEQVNLFFIFHIIIVWAIRYWKERRTRSVQWAMGYWLFQIKR